MITITVSIIITVGLACIQYHDFYPRVCCRKMYECVVVCVPFFLFLLLFFSLVPFSNGEDRNFNNGTASVVESFLPSSESTPGCSDKVTLNSNNMLIYI